MARKGKERSAGKGMKTWNEVTIPGKGLYIWSRWCEIQGGGGMGEVYGGGVYTEQRGGGIRTEQVYV